MRFSIKKLLLAIGVTIITLQLAFFAYLKFTTASALEDFTRLSVYRVEAWLGDAEAQYHLGNAYWYGGRGVSKDPFRAVAFYRRSAEQGYMKSMMNLGAAYYEGRGVEQNYEEAFRWYQQIAADGNVPSQLLMADSYYLGRGVEKNYQEAVRWYAKAAMQGNAKAYLALGYAYRDGWGVAARDFRQAREWFQKAAALGNLEAQRNLEALDQYLYSAPE